VPVTTCTNTVLSGKNKLRYLGPIDFLFWFILPFLFDYVYRLRRLSVLHGFACITRGLDTIMHSVQLSFSLYIEFGEIFFILVINSCNFSNIVSRINIPLELLVTRLCVNMYERFAFALFRLFCL